MSDREYIPFEVTQQDIPQVIYMPEVVSTNSALRELLEAGGLPEGSVLWTDYQTAGRGQAGNGWESEARKNLTFSIVLYPNVIPARDQFILSQITALSVKKTLDGYVGGIRIKWPNDIYWRDKKICGTLIENDLSGASVCCSIIGVGININQEVFSNKTPNPVSLLRIAGRKYHREEVLDRFLSDFYAYYLMLLQGKTNDIRATYRASLYRGDDYYPYRDAGGDFEAMIAGVEPTGHLLLRRRDGEIRRYTFREVSYVMS